MAHAAGFSSVSEILAGLTTNPTLSEQARQAIQDGLRTPHQRDPWCPCARCVLAFVRPVR